MRAPARAQRRTKPSLAARVRVFWVFITVGLMVVAGAGFALANWSYFDPKTIVVDGNRRVATEAILTSAAIPKDRNVWLIDKKASQRRIEAIPWIKTARIHRMLPASVSVAVTEREPVACVESGSSRYLVDETGRVIETACPAAGLPLFAWPQVPPQDQGATLEDLARLHRMVADAGILDAAKLDAGHLGFDRFDGLEVRLNRGPLVLFGNDRDLAEKARLVDPILRTYGPRARDLAVIDLRTPATPVVQERNRPKV